MTVLKTRVPSSLQEDQLVGSAIAYSNQDAIVASNTAPNLDLDGFYYSDVVLDRTWVGDFTALKFSPTESAVEYKLIEFDTEIGTKEELGPFGRVAWGKRYMLKNGLVRKCDLYYSVSPDQRSIILHPVPDVEKNIKINYRTSGTKFADAELIGIPEELEDRFISACSDYVRSRLAKDVDRNAGLAGINFAEFKRQLRSIFKQVPR